MGDQWDPLMSPKRGVVTTVTEHGDNFKMTDVLSKFKTLVHQHAKLAQCVGVVTGCLLAMAAFLSSYFHVLLVLWSVGIGLLVCFLTIRPSDLAPNLISSMYRDKTAQTSLDEELTVLKTKCPVCGKENCNRHRPELNIVALKPWTHLQLPQTVDAALEEFLNLVLKEFVYTWYRDLSQDEAFVDELRTSLRFIVSVLFRRIQKVDIPSLVLQKILKIAIRHLHFYLEVKRKAEPNVDMQQAVLDFYNGSLHIAMRNRWAELDYLKSFAERVFPYILPILSHNSKSLVVLIREILAGAILLPAMDVLADPDIINNLLLIFFERSPPQGKLNPTSPLVPILQNFSQPISKNDSCLHLELDDILENTDALFHFMQFLKAEASVNVLQFYLAVDEFNNRLLTPELSEKSLTQLHQELTDMYRLYCDPAAVDRIEFEDDIIDQLRQICEGPAEGVIKLQTTTPLFRAHERMYILLKDTFLPLFHQSDDYYKMLCGERLPTMNLPRSLSNTTITTKMNSTNNINRSGKRQDSITSKLGSRLKGVFKSSTARNRKKRARKLTALPAVMEGDLPDDVEYAEEIVDSEGDITPSASSNGLMMQVEELIPTHHHIPYHLRDDGPLRDLSAWRVTIPEILTKYDPDNPKREIHFFVIEVRRVDVLENDFEASNWTVERRYQEFHVLEQKLTEFHGEFDDIHLPPKKAFGTKKRDFMESIRLPYELYLQNLLSLHLLKSSELLYTFLTPYSDFSTSVFPDINLGKMMKSGALKLVKERGQNLDIFLQSLLLSTESAKPKPSRFSDKDSDTASISSEKMSNFMFENNANMDLTCLATASLNHAHSKSLDAEVPVHGICDTLIYLAENVYKCQPWLLQLLLSLRIMCRRTLDTFVDWYFNRKLKYLSQEHKVIQVIHLLRDALFFDTDPPRSDEDKLKRKEKTLQELKDYIPRLFVQGIGLERHNQGTELLFEVLQHPKLNKQLSYMLLDVVIEEVFPELTQSDDALAELHKRLYKANDTS